MITTGQALEQNNRKTQVSFIIGQTTTAHVTAAGVTSFHRLFTANRQTKRKQQQQQQHSSRQNSPNKAR